MIFDSEAYAEGICNSAAGSSIEMLVDTIDATIAAIEGLDNMLKPDDDDLNRLAARWEELRAAIVQREKDAGETTYFGED